MTNGNKQQSNLDSWIYRFDDDTRAKLRILMDNDLMQRKDNVSSDNIYPPHNMILNALCMTGFNDVKAVILGQDPYHQPGQAMGLSFSVQPGINIPPSLRNIFNEYTTDLHLPYPANGDLTRWAENGVLLLNTILTVERGKPLSHADIGWETITSEIIKLILKENPNPVVFILWGKKALNLLTALNDDTIVNKFALSATHPSPYSANSRTRELQAFIGSKPFSSTNKILIANGVSPIDWTLS